MKRVSVASALSKSVPKEYSSSMPNPAVEASVEIDPMTVIKKYQASLMVASTMTKAFHYCVTGMGFYTIHPVLGKIWDELDDIIDEVAELLVIHQQVPVLTMQEAIQHSLISEYSFSGKISNRQAMIVMETMFDSLAKQSKDLAVMFDEAGEVGVSGLFGDHNNYYTKSNWMVKAYLNE